MIDKIETSFTDANGIAYWGRMKPGNEVFASITFATYIISLLKLYDLNGS